MKTRKKIIGLFLLFTFSLATFPSSLLAEENEIKEDLILTPPEQACHSIKPDYYLDEEITDLLEKGELIDRQVYEKIFERAQTLYHSYVGCMFEFAENTVYQSKGSDFSGGVQPNTPNTDVIDWMAPDQACLSPSEISKIIEQTTPTQMLGPILQAHKEYKDYLNELGNIYSDRGIETDAQGNPTAGSEALLAKANSLDELGRERQVEIDSAMVAMDLMFNSLKELRLAFVMHVRFQCTLKFLDRYRNELGELRKLIQPLPGQLRDASITK